MNRPSLEDIMVWPDGTWCYRYELTEYSHMSDDYTVLEDGSIEWEDFLLDLKRYSRSL